MAKFNFTANTITCAGRTFPVEFSVTSAGAVLVSVTMPNRSEPTRVKFTPEDEAYPAALNSYNKKLTFKAHRAAVALSGELAALYA